MSDRSWVKQIPNTLSISRIGFALIFPFVPTSWQLPLIALALLSEFFDGFLARRLNAVSRLGAMLDPIADKLFILSTVFVLISEQTISLFDFLLIAARDITVAIGSFSVFFLEGGTRGVSRLQPRYSGKIATTFQFFWLVAVFARLPIARPLLQITIVVSCLSAVDYLYAILHRRFDPPTEESAV